MECSLPARLLFIGLWNFCDDHGRHPWAVKQIKALVFPSDDMHMDTVSALLDELAINGLIVPYDVDGKRYFCVTGWQHQKIDKRQDPKFPSPPSSEPGTGKDKPDTSTNDREKSPKGRDHSTNGIDGREYREEEKGSPSSVSKETSEGRDAPLLRVVESPHVEETPDAELYRRGKKILGAGAGGLIAKLLKAKGGNIALARAAIETASTKQDPREYVGALLRARERDDDMATKRLRGEAW